MPKYTFLNKDTEEVEEYYFNISSYDQFIKDNPHLERFFEQGTGFAMGDSVRLGIRKNDEGFREVVSKIASANYKSNLADRLSRKWFAISQPPTLKTNGSATLVFFSLLRGSMSRRNAVAQEGHNNQTHLQVVSNKLKIKQEDLKEISPLTINQKKFFDLYENSQILLLHGVAGSGKTYIALFKALEEVLNRSSTYKKVVVVRSAVPSREIGHLPWDEKEKAEVYQRPYEEICEDLFARKDAFSRLQEQNSINFMITSFVRGITLDDSIIIVDECQNMSDMELNSIITRVGNRSKIIFCGDFRQTDLYKKNDLSGLKKFMVILDMMPSARTIEFQVNDIVRSSLVKEYIIARMNYEENYVH